MIGCKNKKDPATPPTTFDPVETITYTITWVDENGNTIHSGKVKINETPAYTYNVSDTAEWDFTFEGWSSTADGEVLASIPVATADATYYAKVSAVKQKYTVTFNSNGGSAVTSQTVEYGDKVSLPDNPTYENHKFICWCYDANGTTPVDFDAPITSNAVYYAIWNETADVKGMLSALLNGYKMSPSHYIPESMGYDFSDNLVDADDIVTNYSGFVNVSDITYGFGEQWHMVLENLRQTNTFFNVLSVVEALSTESITIFNDYFDRNPSDTAHHEFEIGVYNVTVDFDGEVMFYVLDFTTTLPVFGEQTVQIALSMDVETGEKNVRIQAGDANALSYKITENSYEFAIKYLGVRRAMFSIERTDDGNIKGSIYEFVVVSSVEIASAAEFYITEDYVSVVGNKANGMTGFTGYINELYDVESGKMIGYEVNETLSSIVYNTLWFNLNDISGINSIKYRAKNGDVPAAFFINGIGNEWETKNVGGLGLKMLSRRFDIEFRTQYVYSYDATTGEYVEHAVQVPMLFVQEECYEDLIEDVESTNDVTITVLVTDADLTKILDDYDTLIPIFVENKESVTTDDIVAYIGNKIIFMEENN